MKQNRNTETTYKSTNEKRKPRESTEDQGGTHNQIRKRKKTKDMPEKQRTAKNTNESGWKANQHKKNQRKH